MSYNEERPCLLVVDDDPEDILLVRSAIHRSKLPLQMHSVPDGEALLLYLRERVAKHTQPSLAEASLLILLDLNMPRKDGRSCLREMKMDSRFSAIPIIVFSTSDSPDDILQSYQLGANSYICKPDDLEQLEHILQSIYRYWFAPSLGAF